MRFESWTGRIDPAPFTVRRRTGTVRIGLACDDGSSAGAQRWRCAQLLSALVHRELDARPDTVIIDLWRDAAVSTCLLAVIVDARARGRRTGTRVITRGSPALHRLASVCRLGSVLESV